MSCDTACLTLAIGSFSLLAAILSIGALWSRKSQPALAFARTRRDPKA